MAMRTDFLVLLLNMHSVVVIFARGRHHIQARYMRNMELLGS